jgi:hypothetical protein
MSLDLLLILTRNLDVLEGIIKNSEPKTGGCLIFLKKNVLLIE